MIKLLFLDCDGVINDHQKYSNGYCGFTLNCVDNLNLILTKVPEVQIVVHSAWRYYVHRGEMTLKGLEGLLLTGGINCFGRLHGITEPDKHEYYGPETGARDAIERAQQITDYNAKQHPKCVVVLDDLPLPMSSNLFIRTQGNLGLTRQNAFEAIRRLT